VKLADLISPKYVEWQRELHAAPRGYGGRGDKWAGIVLQIAIEYQATSILDYGCGRGSLAQALRVQPLGAIRVDEYDPAIRGKDSRPSFADLVVCTDVIEHIEPDRLDNVLAHLRSLARKAVFVVISTKESNKVLPNGRNAHLIIKEGRWWRDRLREAGFTIHPPPTVVRLQPEKEWVAVLTP
jgi:2-polyprenyl-3-methyl-5-hydroxy-6-metoxy-1,4-benzoquinol methylase